MGPAIAYLSDAAKKTRAGGGAANSKPGEAELSAVQAGWFVANGDRVVALVVRCLADVDMMEEITLPRLGMLCYVMLPCHAHVSTVCDYT